jgi:hypothetical protein
VHPRRKLTGSRQFWQHSHTIPEGCPIAVIYNPIT